MNEKDLVSNSTDTIRNNHPIQHHMKEKGVNEENDMDPVIKGLETEEQQATQFLFCKHFSEINYDRVFESQVNPFKLN